MIHAREGGLSQQACLRYDTGIRVACSQTIQAPRFDQIAMTSQTMPHGPEVDASSQHTELEDPNAFLRTEFLQRLAHDLRGHAGVIHGALQELEASMGASAASGELFLAMAKRGVKRILRTADKLQQTGQIERGTLALSKAECDIRQLIKEAAEEAHGIEGRKKINVELDMPGNIVSCPADGHWLSAAFFELLANAIRHAQARVRVTVTTKDENTVSIEVTDDGKPTAPFGPSRFQSPRDRRGLGLGLSIVSDVAAAHGGSLNIVHGNGDPQRPFGVVVQMQLPRS
jgi:two-component system OmpR family sensor kinase